MKDPNAPQMIEPDANPLPEDTTTGARGDFAVVGELLPYLRPYLGRIVLALGLIRLAEGQHRREQHGQP